ncbi:MULTISPECIES: hypothetical protein [unclassified Lentimonas]|uniref:hypothetical protein n=1 Tax=unclassified Lentimonas TaxID=2630993 RepID=UPI00132ACF4B|nr:MULTISPECIES: hypothetical protein [unclassified Lentimonas]CAA6692136.1 Unannotated [Lentimonas sp. CC19]CAA6694474.1 Unannotated [Lentimonas sp. CC10]CAA7070611.1 Unannotated [Lentimonas sp. CC11]
MKLITTLGILLLSTLLSSAEHIKITGTSASFDSPEGFKPLSKEIIELKWPSNRAPRFAVGNESASTTVAYDLKPHLISQSQLQAVLTSFEQTFNRVIPGIEWKKKEIIEIDGQKWIFLEMTSNAVDADIYNIMLITGLNGQMLAFNFNSTKSDFPKYENSLRESIKSIKLN